MRPSCATCGRTRAHPRRADARVQLVGSKAASQLLYVAPQLLLLEHKDVEGAWQALVVVRQGRFPALETIMKNPSLLEGNEDLVYEAWQALGAHLDEAGALQVLPHAGLPLPAYSLVEDHECSHAEASEGQGQAYIRMANNYKRTPLPPWTPLKVPMAGAFSQ